MTSVVGAGEAIPGGSDSLVQNVSFYEAYLEIGGSNLGAFSWNGWGTDPLYSPALMWSNRRTATIAAASSLAIRSIVRKHDGHPSGVNVALRSAHRLGTRYDKQGGNDIVDAAALTSFQTGVGGSESAVNRESPFVFGWTTSNVRTAVITGDSIGYGGSGYGATSITKNGASSYIEIALWQNGSNPIIWFNTAEPAASLFNRYSSEVLPTVTADRFDQDGYSIRSKIEEDVDFTDEFCSLGVNEFVHASAGFQRAPYLNALEAICERKIQANIARKRRTYLCIDPMQVVVPMPSILLSESAYLDAQTPVFNTIPGAGGATQLRRDLIARLSTLCQRLGNSYVIDATAGVQATNSRGELVWKKGSGGEILVLTSGPLPDGDGTHPNELACNIMAENIRVAIGDAFATTFAAPGLLASNPAA